MADFKFEILKNLGALSKSPSGWQKELNFVSWNGGEPKLDLREWSPDHSKMGKGVSLTVEEAQKLYALLKTVLQASN